MDGDEVVAVGSTLLVPEAKYVDKLVHDSITAPTPFTKNQPRLVAEVARSRVATKIVF